MAKNVKTEPKKAAKADAKAEKADKGEKKGKGAAKAAAPEETVAAAGDAAPVDPDELEEEEDAAAAGSAGAAGGPPTTEMSTSFKNFRHHPDMENFYRFIFENDLRHEALAIIDTIMVEKANRKQAKLGKGAH